MGEQHANGWRVSRHRLVADATVGVIANPMSGRDIRRLVASASVFPNAEADIEGPLRRFALGKVSRNVAGLASPPRVSRKEIAVWAPEQIRRFLDFTANHRLAALWRLAVTTGARRGELLGSPRG